LYSNACHDWRRRAILTQTWPHFKADFAEAHRDLGIIQTAAHGAGYQSANAAMDDLAANYRRETTKALGNLATATAADRTAIANLTQANTSLSTQLGTANTSIASMNKQLIETLQIQLRNLNPPSGSLNRNDNGRNDNNNSNSRNDNNNRNNNGCNNNRNNRNGNNNGRNNDKNTFYCHTHDRTHNDEHTSSTNCRNPSNGHATTAMLTNRMNGSEQWCAGK
jgi:hypothetical protein